MSFVYYFISFFLIINVIVLVHEYGHYLAAKSAGVKVETFSLGMGPEICGFTDKHGTRWRFSLLPIGGYVMMLGDGDIASSTEDEESLKGLSEKERKRSVTEKSNWEKILISFSGPFFNYIYAFVVVVGMSFFYGVPMNEPIVGSVLKDSPAEKIGILAGDRIISVDGRAVGKFRDVLIGISNNESGKIDFVIERNGVSKKIEIVPEIKETKKLIGGTKKAKLVGIRSGDPVFVKKNFIDSIKAGFQECVSVTLEMCQVISRLFVGKKSIDDFGGIVRMAEVAGDLSKSGNFAMLIIFTVQLSLSLGFLNLFPLPVLDGGNILISLIEQVIGRKLNTKMKEYVMTACGILLIFLMLWVTLNDVLRLEAVNKFVSRFIG
ncbi:MAG: RIP metalloprotease [Holosporaceae bacterium]|jgi:regulator of sigma E protease|nr:RIP metalloprotease [Holosporaceae bacterium]